MTGEEALQLVIERRNSLLQHITYRFGVPLQHTEDAYQDGFVKFLSKIYQIRPEAPPKAIIALFLLIVKRERISKLRKSGKTLEVNSGGSDPHLLRKDKYTEPNSVEIAEHKAKCDELIENAMEIVNKHPLVSDHVMGLSSVSQTSKLHNRPAGTIKSRTNRVRITVRQDLDWAYQRIFA